MCEINNLFRNKVADVISASSKNKKNTYRSLAEALYKHIEVGAVKILDEQYCFTISDWESISKLPRLKKRTLEAHHFIARLMKNGVIHPDSVPYPRNTRLISPNQLTEWYLKTPLTEMDLILDMKESVERLLDMEPQKNYELLLYCYLRFLTPPFYRHQQLVQFRFDNNFWLNNRLVFVIRADFKRLSESERNMEVVVFDEKLSKWLDKYMRSLSTDFMELANNSTLFGFSNIFSMSPEEYMIFLNDLLLKNIGQKLPVKLIQGAVLNELQFQNSPLASTIVVYNNCPVLTLAELNSLFPNTVPASLLAMENRVEQNKRFSFDDDESDLIAEIETHLNVEHDLMEIIRSILKKPYTDKGVFIKLCVEQSEKIKAINDNQLLEDEYHVAKYLRHLIYQLKSGNLAPKTFKQYLGVLTTYCFQYVLYYKALNPTVMAIIKTEIIENDTLENSSKIKYLGVLDQFFSNEYHMKIDVVISDSMKQRSLIFKHELDLLVETLIVEDKEKYNIDRMTGANFYRVHARAVSVILLFYSGLRFNELRSRMMKDFYKSGDSYVVDVNRFGFRKMIKNNRENYKSLKNRSAKRRVKFTIDDPILKKIVDDYYDVSHKQDIKYMFVAFSKTRLSAKPMREQTLAKLNNSLKNILGRNVVLHSLRHSFVTYQMKKILEMGSLSCQKDLAELCNMIGHSEPEVTLSSYFHKHLLTFL